MVADVVCPLCRKVIGGCEGVPDITVRFFCFHCRREVTIGGRRLTKTAPLDKVRDAVLNLS